MALRYASDKLKENKVVVLAAFKENIDLASANIELKQDKKI